VVINHDRKIAMSNDDLICNPDGDTGLLSPEGPDELTGALSRSLLCEKVNALYESALQTGRPFSIALVDIDKMSFINEVYSREAGDSVLAAFCEVIRSIIKGTDAIGRIGGDKFAVLFSSCRLNVANVRMSQARDKCRKQALPLVPSFTFSYGVAELSEIPEGDAKVRVNSMIRLANQRLSKYRNRTAKKTTA